MIEAIHRRVMHRAGLSAGHARDAIIEVFRGLGRWMDPLHREALARDLPELAPVLRAGDDDEEASAPRLVDELANALTIPRGEAWEVIQVVLAALAEFWEPASVDRFAAQLGGELAALMVAEERSRSGVIRRSVGAGHQLSTGRAGARHSLAESDVAQPGSVARGEGPHPQRLSSARGTEAERLRHTLADGRPGSTRPLAGEGPGEDSASP